MGILVVHDTHCYFRRHGLYGPGIDQDLAPPSGSGNRAVTSRQEGSRPSRWSIPRSPAGSICRWKTSSPAEVAARAECVFSCLPHGASAAVIPALLDAGCRVVDFSADYRLERCRSVRPLVRPKARRSRPAGQGGLRAAGIVPRADSALRGWWPIRAAIRPRPSWRWPRS